MCRLTKRDRARPPSLSRTPANRARRRGPSTRRQSELRLQQPSRPFSSLSFIPIPPQSPFISPVEISLLGSKPDLQSSTGSIYCGFTTHRSDSSTAVYPRVSIDSLSYFYQLLLLALVDSFSVECILRQSPYRSEGDFRNEMRNLYSASSHTLLSIAFYYYSSSAG